MAENRRDGDEHRPMQRGSDFWAAFHFWVVRSLGGRGLAIGRRSGRGIPVPGDVVADGGQGVRKEISKKTYEIIFQGHSRLRRE